MSSHLSVKLSWGALEHAASERDWHGAVRRYVRLADGGVAPTLKALVAPAFTLDRVGVEAAWGLREAPERTVIAGIQQAPTPGVAPTVRGQVLEPPASAWAAALQADVAAIATDARAPALALGGGVDAAVVLAAWRASGLPLPAVYTLATGLARYDEVGPAQAIASALGARCEVIRVAPDCLVEMLPSSIAAAETPLYNLHPVSRFALATQLKQRGHDVLVTGDGADAAFLGRPDWDYVPVMAALTASAGLKLSSPFFSSSTLSATLRLAPDRDKRVARDYALSAGLPKCLVDAPKRPRWMPPLELDGLLDTRDMERLSRALGRTLTLDSDRARVGLVTLGLLVRHLEHQDGDAP